MRFAIYFQEPKTNATRIYTEEAPSHTVAIAKAKTTCRNFGVRYINITPAPHTMTAARTLRDALENATNEQDKPTRLTLDDYNMLLEIALHPKDPEWFRDLSRRKHMPK